MAYAKELLICYKPLKTFCQTSEELHVYDNDIDEYMIVKKVLVIFITTQSKRERTYM